MLYISLVEIVLFTEYLVLSILHLGNHTIITRHHLCSFLELPCTQLPYWQIAVLFPIFCPQKQTATRIIFWIYVFANLSLRYFCRIKLVGLTNASILTFLFTETTLIPLISILKGLFYYYKIGNLSWSVRHAVLLQFEFVFFWLLLLFYEKSFVSWGHRSMSTGHAYDLSSIP